MKIPDEITIVTERRKVAIRKSNGIEYLGFFHKWTEDNYALVEDADGWVKCIPANEFRFLPVDNEIEAHELEKIYCEIGLLKTKGGVSLD